MGCRALFPGVIKGIATADFEAFLIEPNWDDVGDVIDASQAPIEGGGVRVQPATVTGILGTPGIQLWSGGLTWVPVLHSQQSALWRFIEHAMGRTRSFWMPSWRSDFEVKYDVQPASSNVIHVEPVDFEFVFELNRYGVYVELMNRTYHIYRLVGFDPISGRLTLNGSLDTTFRADEVGKCSLIRRVRFDSDSFKFKFRTDAVTSLRAGLTEVLGEGVFI